MLAANFDFEIGTRLPAKFDGHFDELSHAFLIDGGKRIDF